MDRRAEEERRKRIAERENEWKGVKAREGKRREKGRTQRMGRNEKRRGR